MFFFILDNSNLYGSGVAKFAKVTVIGRTAVRIGSGGSGIKITNILKFNQIYAMVP